MITISIKHLFAILELRGKEAENTVGHSWPYCRAYRVVCQKTLDATVHMVTVGHIVERTEWSAKGLLGQKPPCFLHQNFLPSSQLGRAASPIVVILKNMSTSIHGNAIKRTTSNSQQASSHTCPLSEKDLIMCPPPCQPWPLQVLVLQTLIRLYGRQQW